MSFNCFKRVNGDHLIDGHSMEDLKSDLHMCHSKWQKYGLSLKKDVDYDAAIAKVGSSHRLLAYYLLLMLSKILLILNLIYLIKIVNI